MKSDRNTSFRMLCSILAFSAFCSVNNLSADECKKTKKKASEKSHKLFLSKDLKRGKHGHRGYQGQQGGPGKPGTPGVPGTPGTPGTTLGTLFMSAVADDSSIPNTNPQQFYSSQQVNNGGPILFDPATQVNDGNSVLGVTLSADGSTFTINEQGFYEVTFGAMYDPQENTTSAISLVVSTLSFPPQPPETIVSTSSQNGLTSNKWAEATVIIEVGGTTTLQIVNSSTGSIQLLDSTTNGSSSAFITIVQVADL